MGRCPSSLGEAILPLLVGTVGSSLARSANVIPHLLDLGDKKGKQYLRHEQKFRGQESGRKYLRWTLVVSFPRTNQTNFAFRLRLPFFPPFPAQTTFIFKVSWSRSFNEFSPPFHILGFASFEPYFWRQFFKVALSTLSAWMPLHEWFMLLNFGCMKGVQAFEQKSTTFFFCFPWFIWERSAPAH